MVSRIVLGLGISLACFAVAGRRFFWLSKLIRSGKPADRAWQGFRRAKEGVTAEIVEVAGYGDFLVRTSGVDDGASGLERVAVVAGSPSEC